MSIFYMLSAILFVIGGAAFMGGCYLFCDNLRWTKVDATVMYLTKLNPDREYSNSSGYYPIVRYEFQGKVYESIRLHRDSVNYAINQVISIRVNPEDPYETDHLTLAKKLFIAGILLLAIAIPAFIINI